MTDPVEPREESEGSECERQNPPRQMPLNVTVVNLSENMSIRQSRWRIRPVYLIFDTLSMRMVKVVRVSDDFQRRCKTVGSELSALDTVLLESRGGRRGHACLLVDWLPLREDETW